jgi:ubiquitin-like-conjugating enzyme ATG10
MSSKKMTRYVKEARSGIYILTYDQEALIQLPTHQVTVEYDVVLSPSYQVPVLYFNIKDLSHRSPPTMDTLYRHLIPPHFKAQTENVGVIGGITIAVRSLRAI